MKNRYLPLILFILLLFSIVVYGRTDNIGINENINVQVVYADSCGVLNENRTLTSNITVSGTCFTVNASNIVIDGAGFTITGNASGYGINNSGGFDNITIRNFAGINNFSIGIYILSVTNNTITNNTITASDYRTYGIIIGYSNFSTITNNTVTTSGEDGHAIGIVSSKNFDIRGNNLNTSKGYALIFEATTASYYNHTVDITNTEQGEPIYYYFNNNSITIENITNIGQLYVTVSNNITIRNLTLDKDGIIFGITENSSITNSNITVPSGYGAYLDPYSNSNIVSNNTITTSGASGDGIRSCSDLNTISNNNITTHGTYADGIEFSTSGNNTVLNNNIITSDLYADGIYVSDTSNSNKIISNTINTSGDNSVGIYLMFYSNFNNISYNKINTSGISAYGIYIYRTDSINDIAFNTINNYGNNAYGINLWLSINSTIFSNNITTSNTYSYGIFLNQSTSNNITSNVVNTTGTYSHGIYLDSANSNQLRNNNVSASANRSSGIYISACSRNAIFNNTVMTSGKEFAYGIIVNLGSLNDIFYNNVTTAGTSGFNHGITLWGYSSYNNVTSNIVSANDSAGVYLDNSPSNKIISNILTSFSGIDFEYSSDNNIITSNTITASVSDGVHMYRSNGNNFTSNTIKTNDTAYAYGIHLYESSNNSFINDKINATHSEEIYITQYFYNSTNNKITNAILMGNLNLTTHDFSGVSIDVNATPPADPAGKRNITNYLTIANTSTGGYIDFNLSYGEGLIPNAFESNLHIYRYNEGSGSWSVLETSSVDTANNIVSSGNVSSFSLFAPLFTTFSIIYQVSPYNSTATNNSAQTFICNISNPFGASNITLYLWNSTGSVAYTNTTEISGIYNANQWNYTMPYDDTFKWNCLGYDIARSYNWSTQGNYTIIFDSTKPAVTISLPQNTTYSYNTSLQLNFTASDVNLDRCWFNLDNGNNITLTNCANATFNASEGYHTLYIFANDTAGNLNNTVTRGFVADLTPPIVNISVVSTTANVSSSVQFNSTGSSDSVSSIANYSWSFDDYATSNLAAPTHIYGNIGNFTVNLTLTDNAGNTNSTTRNILVVAFSVENATSVNTATNVTDFSSTSLANAIKNITGLPYNVTFVNITGDSPQLTPPGTTIVQYTVVWSADITIANQSWTGTATITFAVPNATINAAGLSLSEIKLFAHESGTTWTGLTTWVVSNNTDPLVFSANVTHFSLFAAGKEYIAPPTTPTTTLPGSGGGGDTTTTTTTPATSSTTTTLSESGTTTTTVLETTTTLSESQEGEKEDFGIYIIIIIIILVLIIACFMFMLYKKGEEAEKKILSELHQSYHSLL